MFSFIRHFAEFLPYGNLYANVITSESNNCSENAFIYNAPQEITGKYPHILWNGKDSDIISFIGKSERGFCECRQ